MRSWWATSQTIVRRPRRAAASPRATATVVFPTPPLPVTKTSLLSKSVDMGEGFLLEREKRGFHEDFQGSGHRLRKSEGWRRQDDYDPEPCCGVRRKGPPCTL